MTSRDQYVEKMKAQIDQLNENMKALEVKAQEASDEARAKYDEQISKMQDQSKAAMTKLADMKAAGTDTWDAMIAEMEKVRDAFVHSFSYFKSQLK